MHSIQIAHNFESAHRLWVSGGKCNQLHGHSFWAEVEITSNFLDVRDMVVEFGQVKSELRGWLDTHWDHGVLLCRSDPLGAVLAEHGKVFLVPEADPTTEVLARLLYDVAAEMLTEIAPPTRARVQRVTVHETRVNTATYTGPTKRRLWARV